MNERIVSRETFSSPKVGNDTWQPAIFSGEIQPGEPDNPSQDIPWGDRANQREYDRARKQKSRKKAKDRRLIEAVIEQIGFYGFYQSYRVSVHTDSHIWDTPTYSRDYYKAAAQVIFTGYVPTLRDVLICMVARISDAEGSAPLSLINYLTRTIGQGPGHLRQDMGKMGVLEHGDDAR